MTVLASFLGGLALGNYFLGKKADVISNPIRVYAFLELFIGAFCLLYPVLSSLIGNSFLQIASHLNFSSQHFLFSVLRFFGFNNSASVPNYLQWGGTLPILSKYFVSKFKRTAKDICMLYFS